MYNFENVDIVKNSNFDTLQVEAKEIIEEYRKEAEKINKPFTAFIANNVVYVLKWLDWTDKLSPLFSPVWNITKNRKYTIVDLNLEETAPFEVFEMQKLISNAIL